MKKLFTLFALMLLAGITSLKAQEFQKVTSASELSSGDVIIIGCSSANCYAGPMGTNTFLTSVESQADALRITLGGGSYGWILTTSEGTIGATAVKKLSSTSGTTTWNISFEDGNAFIASSDVACGSIQYNPSAPRFTCYTSTQSPVQIYKSKSVTPPDDTSEFNFYYNYDGTATVTGGPKSGDIVIPSSVSHEGKTYSVTSIGNLAFEDCPNIQTITSLAVIPPVCENRYEAVFDSELFNKTQVYVPNTGSALARYLAANVWGQFRYIYEKDLTGVDTPVMNGETQVSSLINLNGQYISNAQHGIMLQKMSNGTTKKVLMR